MYRKRLIASLLALALLACGGGGGEEGDTTPQEPSAPSNVTADSSDQQCTLMWDSVQGADSYNIYQSTSSGLSPGSGGSSTGVTNLSASGLTNDTQYFFIVTAVNSAGESSASSEVTCTPSPETTSITVNGTVQHPDGSPVQGADVFGRTETNNSTSGRRVAQMDSDTTGSSGEFSIELGPDVLPVRTVVEVSLSEQDLPTVDTAKTRTADSDTLDLGTVTIPDPSTSEMSLSGNSASSGDGELSADNLPDEVDRVFGESFGPDADRNAFPGDFSSLDGQSSLNSSAFVWMEALDAQGNPVEDLGQAAIIRSKISQGQWSDLQDTEPDTDRIEIPMFTYNEDNDRWEKMADGHLEDGQGTVLPEEAADSIQDGSFGREVFGVFETDHLSWMNVDYENIGPWTLNELSNSNRNTDCTAKAFKLAKCIFRTERADDVYQDVNKSNVDLSEEIGEGVTEITDSNLNADTFGSNKKSDYDPSKNKMKKILPRFHLNQTFWQTCDSHKKQTVFLMATTILHEMAHWKHSVTKKKWGEGGEGYDSNEAGLQIEHNLFGDKRDIWTKNSNLPIQGDLQVDGSGGRKNITDDQLEDLTSCDWWQENQSDMDQDFWNNFWNGSGSGGGSGSSTSGSTSQNSSSLSVTLAMSETTFDLGEPIPVDIEYENTSSDPIPVLDTMILQSYPLYFEVTDSSDESVQFVGPKIKPVIGEDEFVTLQPGETLSKSVDLTQDSQRGVQHFNFTSGGTYTVSATYTSNWRIPAAQSNTLTFSLNQGGTVSGQVTDASTGNPIDGAEITAILDGNEVDTTTSDSNGDYTFDELPPGSYTIEANASGHITNSQENVSVQSGQTTSGINFSLPQLLVQGQLQLVLSWNQQPEDLDSHLWLPDSTPYHLYYSRQHSVDNALQECPFAELDTDDTDGEGPETITINTQNLFDGTYRYAVFNFEKGENDSSATGLSDSGAQVKVFDSSGLLRTIDVPSSGSGLWWRVLEIDGTTGDITEIGQLTDSDPAPYEDTASGCTNGNSSSSTSSTSSTKKKSK